VSTSRSEYEAFIETLAKGAVADNPNDRDGLHDWVYDAASRAVMYVDDREDVRHFSSNYDESLRADYGFGQVHARAHEAVMSDIYDAIRRLGVRL
jgi:hypothetical protein